MRLPVDRLMLAFIGITALAAVAIAVIFNHIIDKSYDRVQQVKHDKLSTDPTSELAADLIKNVDNTKRVFSDRKGMPHMIRISDEAIKPEQFADMSKRTDITKFKLLRCEYSTDDWAKIKNWNISSIGLSDCLVDKKVIDSMAQMPRLNQIEMFRCDIADDAFENLARSKITLVKFRKCGPDSMHAKMTARQIKGVARMDNLEHLDISKSDFEPGAAAHLDKAQCEVLNLSNTNITDADMKSIQRMPRLHWLEIDRPASLTCEGLRNLQGARQLKQIALTQVLLNCPDLGPLKSICTDKRLSVPIKLCFTEM